VSALSDFRAAVVTQVATITNYAEAPGGDPEQIPEHWAAGFVVDMPSWTPGGDRNVVVASGAMTVSLWYRRDQLANEQGDWMSAWEAVRAKLESASWAVSGSATIVVTGSASRVVADRFVGELSADWTITYSRS
jgi:hypothetical protein